MKTLKKLFCFVLIFCMLFQCQGFAVLAEGGKNKNEITELVEFDDDSIVSVDTKINDVILDVENIEDEEKNEEGKDEDYDYSEEQEEINENQEEKTDEVLNEEEDGVDNNENEEFLKDETEKDKDEKDFEEEDGVDNKEKYENVASDSEASSNADIDTNIQIDDIIQTENGDNLVTENVPITLTYNFNDNSHDGVGSTDVYLFGSEQTTWTKKVEVGKPYGKFEEFYRPGYVLVGYSFDKNGEIIKEDDIVNITESKTIYAIWEPQTYKFKVLRNVMINDVESDGTSYVEFTFDKDINETMKENGIRPMTADDNEEYACLKFLGWSFNYDYYFREDDPSSDSIVGEDEKVNFTDYRYSASEPTVGALYNIAYVHVILNANEGTYGDGEKFLDLGLVPTGSKLNEAVGTLASYTEPTPPKDMRFEKWWFPEYCYTEYGFKDPVPPDNYWLTVGVGNKIQDFDVNEYKYRWNEEYKAHFEEDRYLITFWGGWTFPVIVGDKESKWYETGYWNDDPKKYNFTNRLGQVVVSNYSGDNQGLVANYKKIYVLKGKNLQEAMDEIGFELPIAWDRDLIGWSEGEKNHPPRVDNKYVNDDNTPFVPITDFSKYTVDGPMHFTAVWKKKPLTLIFKEGEIEQAKYKSGRKQQTIAFEARDIIALGGILAEAYHGSLYHVETTMAKNVNYDPDDPIEKNYPGYEDLYLPRNKEYNDNWEFLRWEDDAEFVGDKCILWAGEFDGVFYPGLRSIHIGVDYREEPIVFTPVVDKIQIPVCMYSPFPIFPQEQNKRNFNVGSGTKLGEVDDYINANFKFAEKEGYHFAGWYMIDHDRIRQCDQWDYGVDDIEFMMEKGRPTVVGISKPGLDTWFKHVQCTVIDDTDLALGQYLTKIDGELVLNRDLKKKLQGIDILALWTSNLTLDAGDGYFENHIPINTEDDSSNENIEASSEKYKDNIPNEVIDETTGKIIKKTIKNILPMIDNEPICTYVGAGYEVPKSNDPNKKFAGWRVETVNGKYFSEYEPIQKDTYLVATYIDNVNTVKLTIDLHGAEKTVVEKDGEGNTVVKVVPMEPVVMELPQGTLMEEVEMPVVKRKGYEYRQVVTLKPAWYHTYDEDTDTYSVPVMTKDALEKDTIIHLMWTPINYSYDFIYEIDGVKQGYKSVVGLYGDKIKDCEFYGKDLAIRQMFDFSLENQPKKGYKITKITTYNEDGKEVTADSVIEGNVRCWLTVEPIEATITFDANGGELEGVNTVKVPFATSFNDIENVPKVSKEGVTFVGWADDNGEKITADYRIKEKTNTFKAQWTNIDYTLVLDAGEGKFSNGSKQLRFENVPLGQVLKNMTFGDLKYEEPILKDKVLKEWEINLPTVAYTIEWTKDSEVGYNMHYPEKHAKSEIVLKASYVDKTISFTVKLSDPTSKTGCMTFANLPHITSRTLYHDEPIKEYLINGIAQGCDWVQTVKEGTTFNQWFDLKYDEGFRYRTENGFKLLGWKHEEPASEAGPRKDTKDMPDVDMDEPIKDGAVFTPLLAKGSHYVWIIANGGTYDKVEKERHLDNGVTAYQFDEERNQMVYVNVPAGTRADRIDPSVLPKRPGYTLVGYSRIHNPTGKSLSANPFVAGTETFYAIWSENKNQYVQPTVHRSKNSRSSGGGGGSNGGLQPSALQNANDPRVGVVGGLGPQSQQSVGDQSNKYTQNVSEETKKQTKEEVNQILSSIGINGNAANNSSIKQAAAEVEAGINLKEQYAKLVNQVKDNPSITEQTTRISDVRITNNQAYWHTDENGNVSLESIDYFFYDKEKGAYSHNIVDAWQPITNETGQTGWYKFDKNGYMQTGLVQDGEHTYYLSEEKGASYGQMVCNQTINIGGLSMTFNEQGALIDMNYNPQAAIKTLQDAASSEQTTSYIEDNSITVPVVNRQLSNVAINQQVVSNNSSSLPVAVQSVKDPGVKQQNISGSSSISPVIPFTARSVNNLGLNQQGVSTNNSSSAPIAVKSVRDPGARR